MLNWMFAIPVLLLTSCSDSATYTMIEDYFSDYDDDEELHFIYDSDDFLDAAEAYPINASHKVVGSEVALSEESIASQQLVYQYRFDESLLNDDAKKSLSTISDYLLLHPNQRVKIEGHTCEIGSREYNIALGWRRADAVKDFLINQGVLASQIEVISYGQEKPVDLGHNDKSRLKNRRAHLKFLQG